MKVLVVSAHPDDETLGCGGTLLKHKKNSDEVAWLIVTTVRVSQGFSAERVASRQAEINTVAQRYGIKQVFQLDFPTMSLSSESVKAMIPKISEVMSNFQPTTLYTLNRSDVHSDHRHTFDAVMACTKSFRYPFLRKVLMYECLSETEFAPPLAENAFLPNYYVDISQQLDEKLRIMEIFTSELGNHPFPRSLDNIKALAHLRGAVAGVQYAEAFQLLKWIDTE
jgi:LmbE family N-acetylglucosaminyl deacetylase